ncbi:MAG: hypothetical protein HQK54_00505 [Oligoflexales bacterium]|nr:hypothetical protein [Oligoflexales bacterium]
MDSSAQSGAVAKLGLKYEIPTDSHIKAKGVIPEQYPHFDGHFDGFPILPAVSQIDIIPFLTEILIRQPIRITEITRAKFVAMIRPNASFSIDIFLIKGERRGRWQITSEGKIFSKGSFAYEF